MMRDFSSGRQKGRWAVVGQFGLAVAITEPSAVAPDAGVYFSVHCRQTRTLLLKLSFGSGATALSSVSTLPYEFKLTHYPPGSSRRGDSCLKEMLEGKPGVLEI